MTLVNALFPSLFTVFPSFWPSRQKNDKKGLKHWLVSAMIDLFNAFKKEGYSTGLILEPWYAYTLFFKK